MAQIAIEAGDLSKTFPGGVVAVNGLDLEVPSGSVYGLIGRNGAGKTTAIRMLMGLLHPSGGTARVLGMDMWTAPRQARALVGYVPQEQQVHAWMTVRELCYYVSHFYETWDAQYARRLASRFDLAWDRQLGLMSGGEQRKVSIILAVAARPEVLFLDEPAAGLDPIARRELVDEIVDMLSSNGGCTVLLSTHIISDLERIAEHVGIMDRARVSVEAPLEELQRTIKRVQVVFDGGQPPEGFAIPGAVHGEAAGPVLTAIVRLHSEDQLAELRSTPGLRVNVFPLGLEDIFIELIGPDARRELTEVQV